VRVHRYAYELEVGPIPAGLSVLHHCDVRNCLNPAHLFLGTQGDNVRDAAMKGRYPRGEQHPWARLTVDDVRYIRAAYADTDCRLKDLAERFGITESAAARIVKRRRWSHVP